MMQFSFNWIDWVIVAVVVYYGYQGWIAGFADLGLSFVAFLGSLWLSVKFHQPVGDFLTEKFGIPIVWSTVLGYIIVAFIAEVILSELAQMIMQRLPKNLFKSKLNTWFGVGISIVNGLIIIAFILLVLLAFPLRGTIKQDIKDSKLGSGLVALAETYGAPVKSTIELVRDEAIKFRTIEPASRERVILDVSPKPSEMEVDDAAEREMLALLNAERAKAGLPSFTVDIKTTAVAREHSRDMFLRSYFAHVNPEGQDAGDRMEKAGVQYTVVGENLAYAPDVASAHQGLMNSPGHRRNILDPSFRHIGIGIISTDRYGMMITQDFTN